MGQLEAKVPTLSEPIKRQCDLEPKESVTKTASFLGYKDLGFWWRDLFPEAGKYLHSKLAIRQTDLWDE